MLRVVGLATAAVGTLIGCMWLRANTAGDGAVLAIAVSSGMAAWVCSPHARAMADKVRRALAQAGITEDAAALSMRMKASQLSHQLNSCTEQLSLSRLADLREDYGDRFDVALALEILADAPGYTVIKDSEFAQAVSRILRREVAA